MKKTFLLPLTMALTLLGCHANQANIHQEKMTDAHTAQLALDWDGVYRGLLPCASCPGILTTITLSNNKTFEKTDFYLQEKNGYFREKGTFAFTDDGNKIILQPEQGTTTKYAVGENKLIMLDKNGEKSSSALADKYELTKASDQAIVFTKKPITGLVTLGHEVSEFTPCNSAKSYWLKDSPDGKLNQRYQEKLAGQSTPYTPVMATLTVKNIGKASEGFAKQYESVLAVVKINSLELITPENYCNQ